MKAISHIQETTYVAQSPKKYRPTLMSRSKSVRKFLLPYSAVKRLIRLKFAIFALHRAEFLYIRLVIYYFNFKSEGETLSSTPQVRIDSLTIY